MTTETTMHTMHPQAVADRDAANAARCPTCSELPIGGHRLVLVDGRLTDCPMNVRTPAPEPMDVGEGRCSNCGRRAPHGGPFALCRSCREELGA